MDDSEKKDPAWKLLSHASHVEPDPFFSRNVAREVRHLEDSKGWRHCFVSLLRRPAFAAVAVLLLLGIVPLAFRGGNEGPHGTDVAQASFSDAEFDPTEDLETVDYLAQLVTVADPEQLSDDAIGSLFF